MFAIIKTGGKQYKISEKDVLEIEKIENVKSGDKVMISEVLLISDKDDLKLGFPYVEGAKVELKVLDHVKGEKIRGYKYKAKKRYQRTWGHRQKYTEVEVVKILTSATEINEKPKTRKVVVETKDISSAEKPKTTKKVIKKAVIKKPATEKKVAVKKVGSKKKE
ncbi:50S ribosomal protein L21 [Candidatus Peregrinibacteria bacterium RIFOXYB2_FULL_32_7]|nr:MAG: 50S ribosomal protein L21 [Candidatus Peregrinibacteria bacterium RIFOXYB2_FULL_32_7]